MNAGDIADRCENVTAVQAAGGRFIDRKSDPHGILRRSAQMGLSARSLHACSCKGKAFFHPQPPVRIGGDLLEILKCSTCGHFVGPYKSRAELMSDWQLGGWMAPVKG